jgi:hypothetical protein
MKLCSGVEDEETHNSQDRLLGRLLQFSCYYELIQDLKESVKKDKRAAIGIHTAYAFWKLKMLKRALVPDASSGIGPPSQIQLAHLSRSLH